jgi:hypothetical protein
MNYPLIRKCILLGTLTLTCSSAALAARIFGSTTAQVSSSNPYGSDQHQDPFEYNNPALMATPQAFSTTAAFAAGSASSAANVQVGAVRAYGASTYAHNQSNSAAQTRTFVRVEDQLTVAGTDPLGGVTFSMAITGLNPGRIFDYHVIFQGQNIVDLSWMEQSGAADTGTLSATVYNLRAGDSIILSYGGDVVTYASSLSNFSTSIVADYSNTAHYYVDAGPGTSFTSATNFNYSSQVVPEPSTGVLLGGVLLGAAIIRRRLA